MKNKSKKQAKNINSSNEKLLLSDVMKSVCPKCNNTGRRWADDGWYGIDCECKRQTVS